MIRRYGLWFVLLSMASTWTGKTTAEPSCDIFCTANEIRSALSSADQTAREIAKSRGLNHADRSVRILTLAKILVGTEALGIEVDNFAGDIPAADFVQKLPTFGVDRVIWSADGRSFIAWYRGYSDAARGSLLGETLSINYTQALIDKYNYNDQRCSVSLQLNAARDALEGPLRCAGVPHRFRARLHL